MVLVYVCVIRELWLKCGFAFLYIYKESKMYVLSIDRNEVVISRGFRRVDGETEICITGSLGRLLPIAIKYGLCNGVSCVYIYKEE
jgi:hypothetical protein